jgi:hypothetical protein
MRRTFAWLDTARCPGLGAREHPAHAGLVRYAIFALVLVMGCGAQTRTAGESNYARGASKTHGSIIGLARDHDTGDPIALAEIRLLGKGIDHVRTTTNDAGHYILERIPPGRYQVLADFAGQPLEVYGIEVKAGDTVHVDLVFTLGRPDPIKYDFGDPKQNMIGRYKPSRLSAQLAIIEGTVNDISTRERVTGAVVSASTKGPHGDQTELTVSDADGRYRFNDIAPGTYAISAYYSISGRGQIEVRRSDIAVAGAEAVFVPLWIEMVH